MEKYKHFFDILSTAISYLFFPVWILPLSFYLLLERIDAGSAGVVAFLLVVLVIVPIMTLLTYLIKIGEIKKWDIQKRQNRYLLYIFTLVCGILLLWLLQSWSLTMPFAIFSVFLLAAALLTISNFFWKISVHAAAITAFALVLVNNFGGEQIWPLLLIPLVGWARIYRKNHTLSEVIGGIILSGLTIYLVKLLRLL